MKTKRNINRAWKAVLLYAVGTDQAGRTEFKGIGFATVSQAARYQKAAGLIDAQLLANGTLYDATPEGFAQAKADM